jgi:hypothetical protein
MSQCVRGHDKNISQSRLGCSETPFYGSPEKHALCTLKNKTLYQDETEMIIPSVTKTLVK